MKKRGAPIDPENITRAHHWGVQLLAGVKIAAIASAAGISRQYVEQMLKKHCNLTPADRPRPTPVHHSKRDSAPHPKAGCTWEQYRDLRRRGITRLYQSQRNNAAGRAIGWELTLWQWWTLWQESGRWPERGHGRDKYAMCRVGDVGPYAVGNVYFATNRQNSCDMQANRKARESTGHLHEVRA